jgi:hypothetical protein
MNTFVVIIIIIVAVAIIAGIIALITGCKDQVTNLAPNSVTTSTDQTSTTTQAGTPLITTKFAETGQNTTPAPTTPSMTIAQATVTSPLPSPKTNVNIIIDHTNWNWYNSQTQEVFDEVAQLRIFFAHASVGANILQGLNALNSSDPAKYPLVQVSSTGTPPTTTTKGNIYEYARGNPSWRVKITDFETFLKNGWNSPNLDIVMNKFCYIDQDADWTAYRDSMANLENIYPTTKLIYWTMPLTTASNSDAIRRSQFNQNLRNWISTQNNKILFDIADIEAWSPDGSKQEFTVKGVSYQILFDGFSNDGGHLNENGMRRMAIGLYSLFSKIMTN